MPHITDEIKRRIQYLEKEGYDFIITEIGGTIGDIESAPFLEAIRQLKWELGREAVSVHLTYVPYLHAAGELKTKPTQHSVKELQSWGLQPDILVLRTEMHLDDHLRQKVAGFCNVDLKCVFQSEDMPSIYEVPTSMQRQGLDAAILRKMGLLPQPLPQREGSNMPQTQGLETWNHFLELHRQASDVVKIGLVGKYDLQDAYKSIRESLMIAATYLNKKAEITFINSEELKRQSGYGQLPRQDGLIICPGFGQRGTEGKILAAHYAREHDVPCFGICLGMQMMVVEFARNALGLKDANSSEMNPETQHPVIDLMEEQKAISQLGGTMRLGAYDCELSASSHISGVYGETLIRERHRHRYEFNNQYLPQFERAGMKCAGRNPAANLVEIVEIPTLRWYIGTQFHPEYQSTVLHPHPLFTDFIKAASGI